MLKTILGAMMFAFLATTSAYAASGNMTPQQRMKQCAPLTKGMSKKERSSFMSQCLSKKGHAAAMASKGHHAASMTSKAKHKAKHESHKASKKAHKAKHKAAKKAHKAKHKAMKKKHTRKHKKSSKKTKP